jgi:hypothetical protein
MPKTDNSEILSKNENRARLTVIKSRTNCRMDGGGIPIAEINSIISQLCKEKK